MGLQEQENETIGLLVKESAFNGKDNMYLSPS